MNSPYTVTTGLAKNEGCSRFAHGTLLLHGGQFKQLKNAEFPGAPLGTKELLVCEVLQIVNACVELPPPCLNEDARVNGCRDYRKLIYLAGDTWVGKKRGRPISVAFCYVGDTPGGRP